MLSVNSIGSKSMNFSAKKSMVTIIRESLARGLFLGVLIAMLGVTGTFIFRDHYQASVDFMISSSQDGQDYYTATRSAEYMSRVLGEVLYSERFIQDLVDTGKVDVGFLPVNKKDRLESWSKILTVKKNAELGFMRISVSGKSDRDVSRMAQAVMDVLDKEQDTLFGNTGNKVSIRLLSGPIIERNPSLSDLSFIIIASILFGMFSVFTMRLVKEEMRHSV